jgi:hypothetical protein
MFEQLRFIGNLPISDVDITGLVTQALNTLNSETSNRPVMEALKVLLRQVSIEQVYQMDYKDIFVILLELLPPIPPSVGVDKRVNAIPMPDISGGTDSNAVFWTIFKYTLFAVGHMALAHLLKNRKTSGPNDVKSSGPDDGGVDIDF